MNERLLLRLQRIGCRQGCIGELCGERVAAGCLLLHLTGAGIQKGLCIGQCPVQCGALRIQRGQRSQVRIPRGLGKLALQGLQLLR